MNEDLRNAKVGDPVMWFEGSFGVLRPRRSVVSKIFPSRKHLLIEAFGDKKFRLSGSATGDGYSRPYVVPFNQSEWDQRVLEWNRAMRRQNVSHYDWRRASDALIEKAYSLIQAEESAAGADRREQEKQK